MKHFIILPAILLIGTGYLNGAASRTVAGLRQYRSLLNTNVPLSDPKTTGFSAQERLSISPLQRYYSADTSDVSPGMSPSYKNKLMKRIFGTENVSDVLSKIERPGSGARILQLMDTHPEYTPKAIISTLANSPSATEKLLATFDRADFVKALIQRDPSAITSIIENIKNGRWNTAPGQYQTFYTPQVEYQLPSLSQMVKDNPSAARYVLKAINQKRIIGDPASVPLAIKFASSCTNIVQPIKCPQPEKMYVIYKNNLATIVKNNITRPEDLEVIAPFISVYLMNMLMKEYPKIAEQLRETLKKSPKAQRILESEIGEFSMIELLNHEKNRLLE